MLFQMWDLTTALDFMNKTTEKGNVSLLVLFKHSFLRSYGTNVMFQ